MSQFSYPESFQRRLLAAMIRHPRKLQDLIEPEYFASPVNTELAQIAKDVRAHPETKYAVLSKPTLLAMVKARLSEKRSSLWPMYRRAIRKIYKQKFNDLPVLVKEALAFSKHEQYRQALVLAEQDVSKRKYDSAYQRIRSLNKVEQSDLGIRYWDDYKNKNRWAEDRSGIVPTRFKLLDKAMGGGVGAGEIAIVEGSAKAGKTTFLAEVAVGGMWNQKNVAIATGELSAFKYRKRIDARLTNIDYTNLFQQRKMPVGTRKKMVAAHRLYRGDIMIKAFPAGKARIRDIEGWLDRLEDTGFHVDLLIVDYLALFLPNERYEERRLNLGQATVELRGLAFEKHIPCWTAAQVNRIGLNKAMLGPSDLAEDISQFFTLDFLIALCQTTKERGTKEDREAGKEEVGRVILAASRDTAGGAIIKVQFIRNKFQIREKGYWTGDIVE